MIIDLHRHLWSILERYPRVRELAARSPQLRMDTTSVQPADPDVEGRGAELIDEMDEAGIDRTVVFLGDYGLLLGEGVLAVEEENRLIAELARRHPDRIVGFVGVDPRRDGAVDLVDRALGQWGMRGLKLHPGAGFYPYDPACLRVIEAAGRHGVPVVVHTGPMASPMLSHTAQPIHLDRVAAEFPNTTFVMQHAGQMCWWEEALNIAFWKPNICLELSMWQWTYLDEPAAFVGALAKMKARIGVERVLFGSDLPGLGATLALPEWVQVFKDLPQLAARHGQEFSEQDAAAILGGNAARLLGLDGEELA